MRHQERYERQQLDIEHGKRWFVLLQKRKRLPRWFINVEDRQQRLTLGGLGRVHRAEVHYRLGIGYYEGMAWEHPGLHPTLAWEGGMGKGAKASSRGAPKGVLGGFNAAPKSWELRSCPKPSDSESASFCPQ